MSYQDPCHRDDGPGRPRLAEALRTASRRLAEAGIPEPGTDARILLCAAAGIDRLILIGDPDRRLDADAVATLDGWLARRAAREPVSRILGSREFWGLALRVTPDVLDPRPDTETLVAAVLDRARARRRDPLRILDLGTGSGAILCALLAEFPEASGWAVDRWAAACRVARGNLAAHGFSGRSLVLQGNWGAALAAGQFDIVASNPPYVESATIATLDVDVRHHDPLAALDGGADGLDAYRILVADLPRLLAPEGVGVFEVGQGQEGAVVRLLTAAGLADIATRRDLAGIARVVAGRRAV